MGRRWLRHFSKLLCFSTFLLIFVGAMVKSTESGLSVPDWPTSFGYNMWELPMTFMKGGVVYEHGHRLLATVIGTMMLIMTLWIPIVDKRDWMRILGFAGLCLVVLQGLLGGLTVLRGLPDLVSILHAILAQSFFVLTLIIAYGLSRERQLRLEELPTTCGSKVGKVACWAVAIIFIQLILGAVMRHKEAGLAIPDFPRMGGTWFPTFDAEWLAGVNNTLAGLGAHAVTLGQVHTHLAHRLGAILVILAVVALHMALKPHRADLRKASITLRFLDGLLTIQLILAAVAIWSHKAPVPTSLHVAVGALMLGATVLLALRAFPVTRPALQPGIQGMENAVPIRSTLSLFMEMTKPRIVQMVLVTTTIGFFLAGRQISSWALLLITLIGTGLSAAGSAVLNNYLEREIDARMPRTRNRVLPSGLVDPSSALAFGVVLVLSGVTLTLLFVNMLSALLVLLTAFLYVLVYTPLKRITWWNTSIGAIPGALPPMIGWAAVNESLGAGAWILFFILFAWQHPHFYSIAWLYREDYRLGGFQMLSVVDPSGGRCFRHALGFTIGLVLVSLLLTGYGLTGPIYFLGAILIGVYMLSSCLGLSNTRTDKDARKVLISSVIYLPLLLLFIMLDAGFTALFLD